jgi:hypothetical protein
MIGMLRSRQGFCFWGTQRFKGSYPENWYFDEMDATRFTNHHAFGGGVATNSGIPELRECSEREARGVAGIRHRSVPRSSLGAIAANVESAIILERQSVPYA